jgi:hypothetical protein
MPGDEAGGDRMPPKQLKKATLGSVARTVFFAFFGVRKRAEHEQETVQLSPAQIILAGLIGAAVFVTSLVLLVRFVIGRATG